MQSKCMCTLFPGVILFQSDLLPDPFSVATSRILGIQFVLFLAFQFFGSVIEGDILDVQHQTVAAKEHFVL